MENKQDVFEKIFSEIDGILLSNPAEAIARLDAMRGLLSNHDGEVLCDVQLKKAQAQNLIGDFENAQLILTNLLSECQPQEHKKIARINNELGNNHWSRGNLDEALDYYLKCLDILEDIKDYKKMCVPLNNIGQVYWYNKEFIKAEEYFNKALKLAEKYQPEVQGDVLVNLGILSAEQEKFEDAEAYYKYALQLYKETDNLSNIPVIHTNLALLYEDTDQDDLAEENHLQAIDAFRKMTNRFGEMHARMNYAGFLISRSKFSQAKTLLDEAMEMATKLEAVNQINQLYSHYKDFYYNTGDLDKAFEFQKKYYEAEIERLESENQEKLNELLTKYETEKKEKEAQILRKKNKLLEKKLKNLLRKWHEQELLGRGEENLGGISTIVSSIAHQWKQPLNLIGLLVQNLVDTYEYDEFDDKTLNKFSNQIHQQLQYMSSTVDDFAYGFRDSQMINNFSLSHALALSEKLLHKSLNIDNVMLNVILNEDYIIAGNESKFLQVVMVILSNAIEKFQNSQQKNARIEISAHKKENSIHIEFADNGAPIPDEVFPVIFDVFFSTKNQKKNSGLGLPIARKIIEDSFQGTISCYNKDKNVVFTIELPQT
jgi:signal transduction histidine kinase/Flp pilus assembly protein TadD